MSFATRYREELEEVVAREFDGLNETLKSMFFREHDEDGTHNFDLMTSAVLNALQLQTQGEGQWWRTGPWTFDDPASAEPHKVGLRPPDPAAGTYNDYNPANMDEAVVLEIEPQGDITLTGLKALEGVNRKRMLMLRNRDSTNSITLKDNNAGSIAANRFDFTGASGGAGGGSVTTTLSLQSTSITEAQIEAMNATPIAVTPTPSSTQVIIPVHHVSEFKTTTAYSNSGTLRLRHTGLTTDLVTAQGVSINAIRNAIIFGGGLSDEILSSATMPNGLAVQASLSVTPAGAGVATAKIHVWYVTIDSILP